MRAKNERIALGLLILLRVFQMLPYLYIVPFWDGGWNAYKVETAVAVQFDFYNFSRTYLAPVYSIGLGLPQYFDFGNSFWYGFVQLSLQVMAILALHGALLSLDRTEAHALNRILSLSIFAFWPTVSGVLSIPNPDLWVMAFFTVVYSGLLQRRTIMVALGSLLLVFSKQTGVVLFAAALVAFGFARLWTGEVGRPNGRMLLRILPILLGPLFYLLLLQSYNSSIWETEWGKVNRSIGLLNLALDFDFLNPRRLAYLVDIFILNFAWLVSGTIGLGFLLLACGYGQGKKLDRKKTLPTLLLLIASIYIVTRFPSWNNPRYTMATIPLLIALFYGVVTVLFSAPSNAVFFQSGVFLLVFFSNFRTFDPISAAIFGTFSVGSRDWLNTEGLSGSIGLRDQLAYNLEYFELSSLHDEMTSDIRPDEKSVFVGNEMIRFFFPGRLNYKTFRRESRVTEGFWMTYKSPDEVVEDMVDHFYFVDMPNIRQLRDREIIEEQYCLVSESLYVRAGYELPVSEYRRRSGSTCAG